MSKENIKNLKKIDDDQIDVGDVISKTLYHWPLYFLIILISAISAYLYLRYTKPVYSSSAKIFIQEERSRGKSGALDDLSTLGSKVVEDEMEVIKSPLILESVIRDKGFNIRYYLKGKVVDKELYENAPVTVRILTDSAKVGSYNMRVILLSKQQARVSYPDATALDNIRTIKVSFNQPFAISKDRFLLQYNLLNNLNLDKDFEIRIDSILPLVYSKSTEIKTSMVSMSGSVFELSYQDEISKRTADFLNAVLSAYNEYTLNDKNQITLNTIRFIEGRLASLGDELNLLEHNVETFKKSRGITEIGESSKLVLDQAREADQRLSQANIQLAVYDDIDKYISSNNPGVPFTPVYGNLDPPLVNMITRYDDVLREKSRLALSVQPGNPLMDEVESQIASNKNTIKDYIARFRRNAITEKGGIQRRVNQVEGKISKIPTYEREFINIQRQQSVKENLYNFLLQRKEESSVLFASNIVDNKIISPAYIPIAPIKPKPFILYMVFILGGIVLATAYIRLKYLLNNKITTKKAIEKITDIPVIAEVYLNEIAKNKKFNLSEKSILTEQILNLRNNLKFILAGINHSPVILFTSSISGEGKTFISSNLGKVLTYNNKKTILLELDLRKPKLSQSLGINNEEGISNYLAGNQPLEKIIKQVNDNERLFIIPSGPIPPNPVELLESDKMKDLFSILRQRFDYIIIDTSPLGMVSDAKSLASYVDSALFVVRFDYTPVVKFKELEADIDREIFKKAGIVFNGVDMQSSYGYSKYGSSNYAYGYGTAKQKRSIWSSLLTGLRQRMF